MARYQKEQESDNIGSGNSSGNGGRQRQALPNGAVNEETREQKTGSAGNGKGGIIESAPRKRADARAEVVHESVSPEHGERGTKLVVATESFEHYRRARLPKTGETPFSIPPAFLLLCFLLASNLRYFMHGIHAFGKKKAEWF